MATPQSPKSPPGSSTRKVPSHLEAELYLHAEQAGEAAGKRAGFNSGGRAGAEASECVARKYSQYLMNVDHEVFERFKKEGSLAGKAQGEFAGRQQGKHVGRQKGHDAAIDAYLNPRLHLKPPVQDALKTMAAHVGSIHGEIAGKMAGERAGAQAGVDAAMNIIQSAASSPPSSVDSTD